MTLFAPGAGPPGGSQPDAAVEFVGYRRGTFTDDQVRGMLAALA
ncbi:hypothetical protein [Sphingomonas sp. Leaf4]|nr:hypothetical protein [Sphingomonas sp. Leaf4]